MAVMTITAHPSLQFQHCARTTVIIVVLHTILYIMQVQIDLLSTVSNVQQVPADELAISQARARSSSRFVHT